MMADGGGFNRFFRRQPDEFFQMLEKKDAHQSNNGGNQNSTSGWPATTAVRLAQTANPPPWRIK